MSSLEWEVEFTDEFEQWWDTLGEGEQESVDAKVHLLERHGPALRRPHAGHIMGSRHANMRELIVQYHGDPYRVLYAFDPRSHAILLIGGNKTGNDRWYDEYVPRADRIYDAHLIEVGKERKQKEGRRRERKKRNG